MPMSATVLQVFISSTNEMAVERESLLQVIEDLNRYYLRSEGILLWPLQFETDTYPASGPDVQTVVNRQIGDYDIYLGMLGSRFGSATPRAGSGTEEEFNLARERHRQNPDQVDIMFYFRRRGIDLTVDIEQLRRVQEFRRRLGPETGTLYYDFEDVEDFSRHVRLHLQMVIQVWRQRLHSGETPSGLPAQQYDSLSRSDVRTSEQSGEDEEGFLDLIESAEQRFLAVQEVVQGISSAIAELGETVELRSIQLNEAAELGNRARVVALVSQTARDMDAYAVRTEQDLPVFAERYKAVIDTVSQLSNILTEFEALDTQDILQLIELAEGMRSSLGLAKDGILEFRAAVAAIPRISNAMARSKRRTISTLDKFIGEIDTAIDLTGETEKILRAILTDCQARQSTDELLADQQEG